MTTFQKLALYVALSLGLVTLAPALSLAQGLNVGASGGASVTSGGTSVGANASSSVKLGANEQKAKDRGNQEIDRRTSALNDLSTRIQAMQRITADFKGNIATAIQNQIAALNQLKAKIDADTDVTTLKDDIKSVTASYRIFALVMPQARIAAAADRVATIVTMMTSVGNKLQARIQAAGSAGADVTALNALLTDMGAKLTDAQTQAQNAITVSVSLQPDNGDKTVMSNNTKALQQARGDIQAAQKDLVAARQDVEKILQGLKSVQVHATSTTQTTTNP